MAFLPFPETLYTRVLETDENAAMGDYTLADDLELTQIVLRINKQGTALGTESFKIQIFGDTDQTTPVFESTSVTVNDINTDISAVLSDNFLADVPFDFSNSNMNAGAKYFLSLKATGYTRNADTFYIGYVMDAVEPVLDRVHEFQTGARAVLIGLV